MLLYILLIIIAIGVLLASEPGRVLLFTILIIVCIGIFLYVGFYVVIFLIGLFGLYFEYKNKSSFTLPILSKYDWIVGLPSVVILVVVLILDMRGIKIWEIKLKRR